MTITTVSTSAALVSALKVAQAGDTIQLAAGTYSPVSLSNLHFATDVTVTSLDPNHAAVLTGLSMSTVNGLTFQSLDLTVSGPTSNNAVNVTSSQDVHFNHVYVHGTLNNDPSADGGGIIVRASSDVSVTDSTFEQLYWGVAHVDSTNLTISGSDFHDLRMDGVRGGGSSYVTIANNHFTDFHPAAGDHSDAIQFWTSGTKTVAHDILVADNVFQRGDGEVAQGVFFRDEVGTLHFDHVTISGNLILGGMYNGIVVAGGRNVTIDDNIVQGFSDMKSWIQMVGVDHLTMTDNIANTFTLGATVTNVINTNNHTVGLATDEGAAMLALWDAAHAVQAAGLSLVGTAGDDTLTGAGLADTLAGGEGADVLTGGAGDDVYIVGSKSTIVELVGGGIDTVQRSGNYALPSNVENLVLVGAKASNGIGNSLDNQITGNSAANVLTAGGGADTVSGGGGADTLNGGGGDDRLVGGLGADVFTFRPGDGKDTIVDFGAGGEHDVIDISAMLAAGRTAVVTDAASGLTITFTGGGNVLTANLGVGDPTTDLTSSATDSIFLSGVHANQLHATATGWVF